MNDTTVALLRIAEALERGPEQPWAETVVGAFTVLLLGALFGNTPPSFGRNTTHKCRDTTLKNGRTTNTSYTAQTFDFPLG